MKRIKQSECEEELLLIHKIHQVVTIYFSDFRELLEKIEDPRRRGTQCEYKIEELVFACIAMFIFKQGSRNHFNQLRKKQTFKSNFKRVFKLRIPHMDTVDKIMKHLDFSVLEGIKLHLTKEMIRKKSLAKYRLFDLYYVIAVDATGVFHFKEQHCPFCSHTTRSKGKFEINLEVQERLRNEGVPEDILEKLKIFNGTKIENKTKFEEAMGMLLGPDDYERYKARLVKHCGETSWFHNVLEARLVTANGFSLSIGTEWIENSETDYQKQDCELKAYHRLSEKIKKMFPQLSICILADGLYPNSPFFNRCQQMGWPYIAAFKKGNLPSVWEEVESLIPITKDNTVSIDLPDGVTSKDYTWINDISYDDGELNWIRCTEKKPPHPKNKTGITQFVYVSSFKIDKTNHRDIVEAGRRRQKIENEGFNTEKNGGYAMTHKYSRVSHIAYKNYYQSLQIAHIIVSIVELCSTIKEIRKKMTLKFLWECLTGYLRYCTIPQMILDLASGKRTHFRFD